MNIQRTDSAVGVVGAGIGGLSAALHLAAAGQRVIIFEQRAAVGGKMSQIEAGGYRWDTGPSVITMRHVFEELFSKCGVHLEDYVDLVAIDPLTRYFYPDGVCLDLEANWNRLAAQIAALDERDVGGYLAFLAHAADLYRITGPGFIYGTPPAWADFRTVPFLDMLKTAPWRTLNGLIEGHVHSPHLRQLLARFATYVGANPYTAPSTLSVISHVELSGGVWYPRGGIYQLAAALARLAEKMGVEIRLGCPVVRLDVKDGVVQGVTLESGETVRLAAVVANLDVVTVYTHLLGDQSLSTRVQSLATQPTSCSGYALLLGIEGNHPELRHHNIFFSSNYRAEFHDIFDLGQPPDEPTVYVAITSKTDSLHAPEGHENWFVLVNVPALSERFDWKTGEAGYRQQVFRVLENYGYPLSGKIRQVHSLTPVEIAERTGAWRGALYGLSSNRALNAFLRPHNRDANIRGLYFAGGTTHPGGGVPMVALSGKVAARFLLEDLTEF